MSERLGLDIALCNKGVMSLFPDTLGILYVFLEEGWNS
jgi:hypothetical protein